MTCRIAVYTVALNEAQHVARWAHATRDADYRLVADTGSTDGTVDLLDDEGISVFPITVRPWRFDTARNAALALLPPDIDLCVSLDMDEIAQPGFFDAIREAWERERFTIARTWIDTGSWWRCERVHARHGVRWVMPVHEVLQRYDGTPERVVDVEATILHRPDDSKPRTNYLLLLELAVKENPYDTRMWTYLARERWFRGDQDGVLRAARTALSLPGWPPERAALCRWAASGELTEEWLIRGTIEAPNEAEAWYALARFHHDRSDWSGCLSAAKRGLECPLAAHYLTDQGVRAWGLHDLAAISAHHLGERFTALVCGRAAHKANPTDGRLANNLSHYEAAMSERPRVGIVIPCWNAWEHTRACLESLQPTLRQDDRVVVVDNGSRDSTAYGLAWMLGRWPTLDVLTRPDNEGWAAACNRGALWLANECPVLIFLNSDTLVSPGWLDRLLAPLADASVGAVGPRSNAVSGVQQADDLTGYDPGRLREWVDAWTARHGLATTDTERLVGFCLAVRAEAFNVVGGFDTTLGLGGYDDDDLCQRLSEAGYRLVVAHGAWVHHACHATYEANGLNLGTLLAESGEAYRAKWGRS